MAKRNEHLTKKEHEIMKILWMSEKPMLISEIHSRVKNVAGNSVHPMINNLINKGYIKVMGNVRVVKTPSRLYAPAVTIDEYMAIQFSEMCRENNRPLAFTGFLNYIFRHNRSKKAEMLAELETFVNDIKSE